MVSVLPDTRNSGTSLEKFSAMFIFLKRFGSLEGLSAGLFFCIYVLEDRGDLLSERDLFDFI